MKRWRKALGLVIALLLVALAILAPRLNAERLAASARAGLPDWIANASHAARPEFSILQGFSLSIRNVRLKGRHDRWMLHADQVRLTLSPWGLLGGRAVIRAVDLVHPVLKLATDDVPPAAIPLPENWEFLRIRQGEVRVSDHRLLWSLDGTMRRIHRGQETAWETQALLPDGSLTLQGRIRSEANGRQALFGSLKLKGVKLAAIPERWRDWLPGIPGRNVLDASLTFDMDANGRWSLLGDARLRAAQSRQATPELSLRGKAEGTADGRLSWRDTYIRAGHAATIATHGACDNLGSCRWEATARKADVTALLSLLPGAPALTGQLDMTASGRIKNGAWRIQGNGSLHDGRWGTFALPDAAIQLGSLELRVSPHFRWHIHQMRIMPDTEKGALLIRQAGGELHEGAHRGAAWNIEARLDALEGWPSLGNLLLRHFGQAADLEGQGPLTGDIRAGIRDGNMQLQWKLDATRADIQWGKRLLKPSKLRATSHGALTTDGSGLATLDLTRLELGDSHIADTHGQWRQGRLISLDVGEMDIRPDALAAQGLHLPTAFQGWHGDLRGHVRHLHPQGDLTTWLAQASGNLNLTGFGRIARWSGKLALDDGHLLADELTWTQGRDHMTMKMDVRLSSDGAPVRGQLDILDGELDAGARPGWPAWLAHAELNGKAHQVLLHWLGNEWRDLRADWTLRNGEIQLSRLRGRLAGGALQSPKLILRPTSRGWLFNGWVRVGAARLGDIAGLDAALGAKLDGYLYLNARLDGRLPWGDRAWQGDGDIEIQRGRWQGVDERIHLAAGGSVLDGGAPRRFSSLTAHFHFRPGRLQLSRLKLEAGPAGKDGVMAGQAAVYPGGVLSGHVHWRKDGTKTEAALSGVWPELAALLPAGTSN